VANQGTYTAAGAEPASRTGAAPFPQLDASYTIQPTYRVRVAIIHAAIVHSTTIRLGFTITRGPIVIFQIWAPATHPGGGAAQSLYAAAGGGHPFGVYNTATTLTLPVGLVLLPGDIVTAKGSSYAVFDEWGPITITGDWWISP